jgi:voltage-gated potassium channel
MSSQQPWGRIVERRFSKFLRQPISVRSAAAAIVSATAAVVIGGAVLVWLLDHREYPNIWVGMWWSVQTVTTVGYGDVTPKDVAGRIIGALVMLEGIAFVTIVTAAITSTFIARAEEERDRLNERAEAKPLDSLATSYADIAARLDRLEAAVADLTRTVAAKAP